MTQTEPNTLQQRLDELENVLRPALLEKLRQVGAAGKQAAYLNLTHQQGRIDAEILRLRTFLGGAQIIDSDSA
ncbi:MAG: hypothetical protein AAF125_15645 [Chloroflexota bacterium]